jgi:septal ring factor EnvC (AmiA/AmiB activator)
MTELEQTLLNAFEQLQRDHEQQQKTWQSAYDSLQTMFETTRRDNAVLSDQVERLSNQVNDLSEKVARWTPEGKRR